MIKIILGISAFWFACGFIAIICGMLYDYCKYEISPAEYKSADWCLMVSLIFKGGISFIDVIEYMITDSMRGK